MVDFVCYIRVSTFSQVRSGLGLSAQRQRILDFVGSGTIVEWFEDHESGAKADRPGLEKALNLCELTGATLLAGSLCRLSRDVAFLETVKRRCEAGGFEFKCCDMPEANSFMLGVMAQMAQYEREQIGERTRNALQVAKRKGVVLGNPHGSKAFKGLQGLGSARAAVSNRNTADAWAEKRRSVLEDLLAMGLSLSGIARELTDRKITTRRGGAWHARGVRNILDRLGLELVVA